MKTYKNYTIDTIESQGLSRASKPVIRRRYTAINRLGVHVTGGSLKDVKAFIDNHGEAYLNRK